MTNTQLDALIRTIDPLAETGPGQWRFTSDRTVLICSIVEPDNRVRIETTITAVEQLDRSALLACLADNSDDLHFCLRNGQLLYAFHYPLDALGDGALIDAIHHIVAQAGNFAAANQPVVPISSQATASDTLFSSNHPNWTPMLKALSDDTRLRLIAELLRSAHSVEELADRLDLTHYNTSKHLRILREAGVIESHKQGRLVVSCIAATFRHRVKNQVLDLGCCSFQFGQFTEK